MGGAAGAAEGLLPGGAGGGAGAGAGAGAKAGAGAGAGGAGLLVQVPGRVRDAGAALEALGGPRAVAAAAATGADLTFRLGTREGGQRLRGRHEPACGLFLRVQRGPGGELESRVAGSFSSAYSFGEMGDFVFGGGAGEGTGAGAGAAGTSGRRGGVLPPVFSRATAPAAGLAEALAPPPGGRARLRRGSAWGAWLRPAAAPARGRRGAPAEGGLLRSYQPAWSGKKNKK